MQKVNQKRAGVVILLSDIIDYRSKILQETKEDIIF